MDLSLPWLYHPDFNADVLSAEETRHIRLSLRARQDLHAITADGKGNVAKAYLHLPDDEGPVRVGIKEQTTLPRKGRAVSVSMGVLRHNDRVEWLVEKLQELGVDELRLVKMDHSQKPVGSLERLERIAISGLKQSHNPYLMKISVVESVDKLMLLAPAPPTCYAYLADSSVPLASTLTSAQNGLHVLIGPEGDFSAREIGLLQKANLPAVTLGSARLRAETAALAACILGRLV